MAGRGACTHGVHRFAPYRPPPYDAAMASTPSGPRRFEVITERITLPLAVLFVLGVIFVVVLHLWLRTDCFNLRICV